MPEKLKASLTDHLDNLLQFWWDEYDKLRRMGGEDRDHAAAAVRQYRQVRRDLAALVSL